MPRTRLRAATVGVAALFVVLTLGSGCGSSSPKVDAGSATTVADGGASGSAAGKPCKAEQSTPAVKGQPDVPVPVGPPPTKLIVKDLKVGSGSEAKVDGTVTVQYVLVSCSTGAMVQSSWSSSPFTGQLVQGSLIDGWIQGIPGMKVGGRRMLVVPPSLGYGAQGQQGIAPDETLIFVVDLLSVG